MLESTQRCGIYSMAREKYEKSHGAHEVTIYYSEWEKTFNWFVSYWGTPIAKGSADSFEEARIGVGDYFRKMGSYAKDYPRREE